MEAIVVRHWCGIDRSADALWWFSHLSYLSTGKSLSIPVSAPGSTCNIYSDRRHPICTQAIMNKHIHTSNKYIHSMVVNRSLCHQPLVFDLILWFQSVLRFSFWYKIGTSSDIEVGGLIRTNLQSWWIAEMFNVWLFSIQSESVSFFC